MTHSDKKKVERAKEEFAQAMVNYFGALKRIKFIEPSVEQYNTLTRQIEKLTKTVERISDSNRKDDCEDQ